MRHALRALLLSASAASLAPTCVPSGQPAIQTPADQSAIDRSGSGPVVVSFAGGLPAGAVVHYRLLAGIDAPPAHTVDLDARFAQAAGGASATGSLVPWELRPGRNALFVNVDLDGDGRSDRFASSTFSWDPEAAADCRFDKGALPADTLGPGTPHGAAIPIEHFVVLMQENRSFDHYLGQLSAEGQSQVEPAPAGATNPDPLGGAPIGRFHQTKACDLADLGHSWTNSHLEWNGGAMDGFTAVNALPVDPSGARTMGYYTDQELPFYHALYGTFAIGDRYFASVLDQTFPNRFYFLAGTSFGHIRNDYPNDVTEFSQPTIFEELDAAGVSWKIYAANVAFAETVFAYVFENADAHVFKIAQFYADAEAGTLPQVAYIDGKMLGSPNREDDEHPVSNVQVGQRFVAKVVNALFASPQWSSTAFILNYDEHGGYWDHVPPPRACIPDDIPPMLEGGDEPGAFDRYGIRVPMVVVSPFSRSHFASHRIYDHTSVLRLIEARFDLPALTRRDANADPMLELFDFQNPPFLVPPSLPAAVVDPVLSAAAECDPSVPPLPNP